MKTEEQKEDPEEEQNIENGLNIYRFKFTEDFMECLYIFSKTHQYDDRVQFKEEWANWLTDNSDIVESETSRLIQLGYTGNILDKMFKSARYYFRKKNPNKPEPKERRPYMSVSHTLINAMDCHIQTHMFSPKYNPQLGFVEFCKTHISILQEAVLNIRSQGIKDTIEIEHKIKKTYKNRYFILSQKNNH
jgi:hypothetical protein